MNAVFSASDDSAIDVMAHSIPARLTGGVGQVPPDVRVSIATKYR